MATSISTVFTTDDIPRLPDGTPLRRSERLKKLRSGHELWKEEQTIEGVDYGRRLLYDVKRRRTWKLYAIRALNYNLDNLWPGRIVKAIDCYPQTNLRIEPYDRLIGDTGLAGPVEAKFRYMIVVWKTDQGVAAIPLYTLSEARLRAARLEEFVSICTEPTWVGETPWAGMPLLAKFNAAYNCEERCFADLSRPHWISGHEPFFDDVGKIVGGEYSKLMDLLSKKEREFRTAAFARFNTNGDTNDPELYEPWTPTKPHQPIKGVRYQDDKTRRMNEKKFPKKAMD